MSIAILWDIENVIPPTGTDDISSLIDRISEEGSISYAMAFGDWNKDSIRSIAPELFRFNFELIHIPKSKKNSADITLVTRGVELIFLYPHIDHFVLISGDADFRPFILSLKKYGKRTWIVCDVKNNASEELLKMADRYTDYREMIDSEDVNDHTNSDSHTDQNTVTKEQAFQLFSEAVSIMLEEKKKPESGSVKIKMKLFNFRFDEKKLGYKAWNDFIVDAMKNSNVIFSDENRRILTIVDNSNQVVPEVFRILLTKIAHSDEWCSLSSLALNFDYKKYGYSRFLRLALDAEKRGYILTRKQGNAWEVKKTNTKTGVNDINRVNSGNVLPSR
jgi:uncharacterized LabA/DUF88 family protein